MDEEERLACLNLTDLGRSVLDAEFGRGLPVGTRRQRADGFFWVKQPEGSPTPWKREETSAEVIPQPLAPVKPPLPPGATGIREDITSGRRLYVQVRYGDPATERLKALGMHYDRELHADGQKGLYWISPSKRKAVEDILATSLVQAQPASEDITSKRVYAKVTYRGRPWYVIAEQKNDSGEPVRARLTNLDGFSPFWVDASACELVRTYEGREQWDGRRYSGRTTTVYPTIGSLRDYRDQMNAPGPKCASCGKPGSLVADMEDGLMKHRGCCDMPPH